MNTTAPHPIVLVDDEKSYTELMSQMLEENLGLRVVSFTRPKDALSALPTLQPSVVVTDYFMPQISGLELIRLAGPLVPAAVFILISGHNLTEAAGEIAQLRGLKACLTKPFGWRTLAEEIVRVWPNRATAPVGQFQAATL